MAAIIENLEDLSVEEVIEQFDVTREQVTAVLEFAAQSLRAPSSFSPAAPSGRAFGSTPIGSQP